MGAISDRMAFRYYKEDAYGTAPSPPTLSTLVITDESLTTNFETTESESVVGDRQVRDLIRTGAMAEGDINFELMFGNIDSLLEGGLANEWSTDVLSNASDMISFGFEKNFQDEALFYAFAGCRVGGLSMNFPLAERITGSVSVMGRGGTFPASTIGDGSPSAAVENPLMVTLDDLTVNEGGSALEYATGFSFDTTNELRAKRRLGATALRNIGLGTFRVTGTLEAYFESTALVTKLVNDTPSEFEITTTDSDANSYVWTFPRFKFTGLSGVGNPGRNNDVVQSLTWTAYRDPSTGITMQVER